MSERFGGLGRVLCRLNVILYKIENLRHTKVPPDNDEKQGMTSPLTWSKGSYSLFCVQRTLIFMKLQGHHVVP